MKLPFQRRDVQSIPEQPFTPSRRLQFPSQGSGGSGTKAEKTPAAPAGEASSSGSIRDAILNQGWCVAVIGAIWGRFDSEGLLIDHSCRVMYACMDR